MAVVDDLKAQISANKITFDSVPAGTADRLRTELLGENTGTKVTAKLQNLILEISKLENIQISSIIRNEGHHGSGRAFDVGNEQIANALLNVVATDAKVSELKIDEIIFDAQVASSANNRNRWNYNEGMKHNFDSVTLDRHRDHIHFAVTA